MIPKTRKEAFKVLELSENASAEEIKKAYRKLALEWHPDKWSDKSQEEQKTTTEKFKEISVAYGILTGEISEEFISQQSNDYWDDLIDRIIKEQRNNLYGSHLSKEEKDLFSALTKRDLARTKILLTKVQNINVKTKPFGIEDAQESILHHVVRNSCKNPDWIEFLEEVLSKYSPGNSTPAYDSNIELYSKLNTIDVNTISVYEGTPLIVACRLGNLDVVNVLLKHGADPNIGGHYGISHYTPLHYALENKKNDIVKALFEHGAKIEKLCTSDFTAFARREVEILLPYMSNRQKSMVLESIAYFNKYEKSLNDHDTKTVKLLLKTGADSEFCDEEGTVSALSWVRYTKNDLEKLFTEHKENVINNNSHPKQDPTLGISPRRRTIIRSALLLGVIGATLAAMGIIPEIAVIGVIATVVLSGIAGAIVGGVAGYLVDVAINQCRDNTVNQQCAAQ
ncbi:MULTISPECIES: ankyrin repeat domain-containing protein [unclassified Wolbachia]|uniref:ankyrin repeat domain-containing protein n=1 Tax=unclassified Wolbachia TaxID=2640676 RepID=UPI00222E5AEB|nr:ankyrin repeat domain-containing protein [Wolbachia endosymbiont (group A) of Apoderus coryli]